MSIVLCEQVFWGGEKRRNGAIPLDENQYVVLTPHELAGNISEMFPATNQRVCVRAVNDRTVALARLDENGIPIEGASRYHGAEINQEDISVNPEPGVILRVVFEEFEPEESFVATPSYLRMITHQEVVGGEIPLRQSQLFADTRLA